MTDITKISNVEYNITDEVLTRKWLSVSAKKTRLLSLSDWTQLGDAHIPQNFKNLWRAWRQKLRAIKKATYTDPDKAMEALNSLEQQIPEKLSPAALNEITNIASIPNIEIEEAKDAMKQYINEFIETNVIAKRINLEDVSKLIDVKLEKISQMLLDNFNSAIDKKISEFNNKQIPMFNDELYQEAVDFLSDNEGSPPWPMLQIYALHDNISMQEMANKTIQDKKEWLRTSCKLESQRLESIRNLNKIETV